MISPARRLCSITPADAAGQADEEGEEAEAPDDRVLLRVVLVGRLLLLLPLGGRLAALGRLLLRLLHRRKRARPSQCEIACVARCATTDLFFLLLVIVLDFRLRLLLGRTFLRRRPLLWLLRLFVLSLNRSKEESVALAREGDQGRGAEKERGDPPLPRSRPSSRRASWQVPSSSV